MIRKKRSLGVALSALLMICVAGCSGSNAGETSTDGTSAAVSGIEASGTATNNQTEIVTADSDIDWEFTARDREVGYEESTAVKIALNGSSAEVSGNGASYADGIITIMQEGTYVFTGALDDGRILVNAPDTDKVQIVLNGAALHCETHAAIFIQQADKVFITLAEGTSNQLTSGAAYELSEDDSNVDGVIFSRADLTLNGSGSLTVEAAYKHAIVSKDDLVITGGTYNITAENGGGLYGKDCVKIAAGTYTIQTGRDGIQSSNEEAADRGFVYIAGGTFTITAGTDGIQAATVLRMDDGSVTIVSGGGSANASTTTSGDPRGDWGQWGQSSTSDSAETESSSAKGLKAGTSLLFNGGSAVIDSSDDSLHSNGNLAIQGGTLTMSSGDDGMHADTDLVINDGVILIEKSYEGIEGNNITINGGDITLTASDDGLNVAGGDGSSANGRMGQNSFSGDSAGVLTITGGVLNIDASGDGLDSNGNLVIEGGVIFVTGPTDNGNGALDYDGTATISGGIIIAVGSTGMAQGMGDGSTQCSILHNFSAQIQAGETVTLIDSSGTVLVSYTPVRAYQSVLVSSPEMRQGETYTLTAGSQSESMTLESTVTSNGSGGMGGGGMKGGGQRPGGGSPSDGASMPEMPSGDAGNMPEMPGGNTRESSPSTVPSV